MEDDIYDPASYARGSVNRDEDASLPAGRPSKHALPTLRVFASNFGNQWLMYGGHQGGTQDYEPATEGKAAKCDWFTFYYEGVLLVEGQETFGNWKVTVRGKNLEGLCGHLSKHCTPTLRPGKSDRPDEASIDSITFEVCRVAGQQN